MNHELIEAITRLVERVEKDEDHIGVLSTGEYIAVAMVLNRPDLLAQSRMRWTMLEAVERLGDDWLQACIAVQKMRG